MPEKNLWEDIKKGTVEGFETLKDEFSKFAKEVEKQGKIVKKKFDLSAIQRKVYQNFTELGKRTYELSEEKKTDILNDETVSTILSSINALKKEVKDIEKEIDKIRKETKSSPTPKPSEASKETNVTRKPPKEEKEEGSAKDTEKPQ